MNTEKIIQATIEYIEKNLEQNLNLDHLSKKFGYSKFYLNRLFSENTGCTIYKYIKMRRLTEAAHKLVFTDKSIIDIAFEANYQSQQAFTKAFTDTYLCSPQVYRMRKTFTNHNTIRGAAA